MSMVGLIIRSGEARLGDGDARKARGAEREYGT